MTNLIVDFPSVDAASVSYYLLAFHHDAESPPMLPVPMEHPLHVARYIAAPAFREGTWRIQDLRGLQTLRRS